MVKHQLTENSRYLQSFEQYKKTVCERAHAENRFGCSKRLFPLLPSSVVEEYSRDHVMAKLYAKERVRHV